MFEYAHTIFFWQSTLIADSGQTHDKDDDTELFKETIGDFGLWQFKISVLMSLLKLPIAWFTLSIVFLAPPTKFWCKEPPSFNLTQEDWLRLSKPNEESALKQVCILFFWCMSYKYYWKEPPSNERSIIRKMMSWWNLGSMLSVNQKIVYHAVWIRVANLNTNINAACTIAFCC